MKKRSLKKLKSYKPVNYSTEFLKYIEHFRYSRIILSSFVFVLYFLMAMDGFTDRILFLGRSDLILFGLIFSYLIYSGIFNLMRAIFCIRHKMFPLYIGGLNVYNGWLEFDYKNWESFKTSKKEFFATVVYDLFVFSVIVVLITIITVRMWI